MGVYNLDLFKCSEHEYTQELVDIIYSQILIPTNTEPIRLKEWTKWQQVYE